MPSKNRNGLSPTSRDGHKTNGQTLKEPHLKGKHFLTLLDWDRDEIRYLLDLAHELRTERGHPHHRKRIVGKQVALVFEASSTRTRLAFEVGARELGAGASVLTPADSHLGYKESIADTARVLSRFCDGIQLRTLSHAHVETLAKYASVPVWNGLSDRFHPTQALADVMTMRDHWRHSASSGTLGAVPWAELGPIPFAFLGDCTNNVAVSLMVIAAKLGLDARFSGPDHPDRTLWDDLTELATRMGGDLRFEDDPQVAVRDVAFVHTDVWVGIGGNQEAWQLALKRFQPYRVTQEIMGQAGPHALFMHCLPAFHDLNTEIGRTIHATVGLDALEVAHEVFEGPASIVFDQAENRLHTIKALMVATLTDGTGSKVG